METSCTKPHLVWRLFERTKAIELLVHANYQGGLPTPIDSKTPYPIGILFAYGADISPRIVTWLVPYDNTASRRLQHEATVNNRFDAWLVRNRPIDLWHLATAWTFYEQWLVIGDHPNWQVSLRKRFDPDLFLDQFLAQSRGWLLWRCQLEALLFAATQNVDQSIELAKRWSLNRKEVSESIADFVLPQGRKLLSVLQERSFRVGNTVVIRGRLHIAAIANIFMLYC